MSLVRRSTGEVLTVKARAWDCPSCGLDKKRKIAAMCAVADPAWLVTLTVAVLPAVDGDGLEVTPDRHARCDRYSHVAEYFDPKTGRSRGLRWRVLASCPHCSAWLSGRIAAWRKRMRRMYGADFQYLWSREDHQSGSIHVHLAVIGLPKVLRRAERDAIKRAWSSLGTGFLDLSKRSARAADRLGWYLGKYIAKRQDQRMARGYRRWSRTRAFAAAVRMTDPWPAPADRAASADPPELVGWLDPSTGEVARVRAWPDDG
jgi:hypothetical protein